MNRMKLTRNALGFIKFMFPNQHAVYLHDTPNRSLFNAQKRAFSHGCVRLDQPFRLGEFVLGPECRRLTSLTPSDDDVIEAHADTVCGLLLGAPEARHRRAAVRRKRGRARWFRREPCRCAA